jgi:hypothetical protein
MSSATPKTVTMSPSNPQKVSKSLLSATCSEGKVTAGVRAESVGGGNLGELRLMD